MIALYIPLSIQQPIINENTVNIRSKNESKITPLKLGWAKYAGAQITRVNTVHILEINM
jgi:di/tripeptidase